MSINMGNSIVGQREIIKWLSTTCLCKCSFTSMNVCQINWFWSTKERASFIIHLWWYDSKAVTLARALNLWVACAFGKISIIPWSSSCTSPCPDSSQGSLEFRWSPGDEHRNIWLQLNIVWLNLGILGKVGLSVLATKCCHLPVLWGQDLLHIQRVCRLNKVDENLPQRTPYKCIFRRNGSAVAKVV